MSDVSNVLGQETTIIRVLKIILKCIVFLLLMLLFALIGLFVGYCIVGDGNFWEVLNRDTWRHIFEFIQ